MLLAEPSTRRDATMADDQVQRVAQGPSAAIFNAAVAAPAIGAAWELGALEQLAVVGVLDVEEFARSNDLEPVATAGMFRALATVDVVRRQGSSIQPGPNFADVYRDKPLFYWLCQGSGDVFRQMAHILKSKNRSGNFYRRDARAISVACREANARFFDPLFWYAMDTLNRTFSKVVDLGSGSGERLIQIAQRYPGVRGLGLDIAASAVELATAAAREKGLADRISFEVCDVCNVEPGRVFDDVELLTCFLMGHDMWPRDHCLVTLRSLRAAFPNARKVLLGDTVKTVGIADNATPVFTLGFEVGHALMGVYLPTIDDWHGAFPEGGWRCVRTHVTDTLTGTVIFELE